jgi:hypothetical protein
MTNVGSDFMPPACNLSCIGRLDVRDDAFPPVYVPPHQLSQADRVQIHAAVREAFADMRERVGRLCPGASSEVHEVSAGSAWLHSYVDFSLAGADDRESLIAGIMFGEGGLGSVRVCGDIRGEESGTVLFETSNRFVPATLQDVTAAACGIVGELTATAGLVASALQRG